MNRQLIHTLVMLSLITSVLMMGCATSRFKLTHVYQPVMLGNVDKIGGSVCSHGRLKAEIDIKSSADGLVSGNTAGIEMLVRLKQSRLTDAAREKIVIQKIYFGSVSGLIIGYMIFEAGVNSWTGVTGAIYEDTGIAVDGKSNEERGMRKKGNVL